jgi:dTDP-4-amino-4,6-dideoxygalactose transaminase
MKVEFNNLLYLHKKIQKKLIKSFHTHLIKSDFIGGSEVSKFENNFKKLNNSKYCISCANGSDALVIAIKALGIKPGDEVITTTFSWIATSAAITNAGGKIIFCDVEKNSFNIDPLIIKKKITKRTVGIIPVHMYGYPSDMQEIMSIAKKNKLWVVEDCAQAHLAQIKKKIVGNFGHFGTFSFYPGKNIGALGDAGCLVTNNKNLAHRARLIANHGGKGKHLVEGINSRLDSIQAAFLNIKLKYLRYNTSKRIFNANFYIKKLKPYKEIQLPNIFKDFKNVYHQFVIRVKKRNQLKIFLKKKNINTEIHYRKALPSMRAYYYLNCKKNTFLNAKKLTGEILSLPIYPEIGTKKLVYISKLVIKFLQKKR